MRINIKLLLLIICPIVIISMVLNGRDVNSGKIKIGILQLVEHDALDQARKGFVDGLEELGLVDGKNIEIDYENAQGEQANCCLLSNKLINKKSDLILAIATPAAQAIANATKNIPILVTAITSPESAGLVESNEKPNSNVSGTSDLAPVKKQIALIKNLKPSVEKIGILFCSNEANSEYQANLAVKEIEKLGLKSQIFTVSQSSEVAQVVQSMVSSVDAIYTPTDNMMASTMPTISSIATAQNIPVVCGETNVVGKGAIGTYGMDYYKLGKLAARQAFEILINGKDPQNMPIEYLKDNELTLNSDIIDALGIKIPDHLKNISQFVKTQ